MPATDELLPTAKQVMEKLEAIQAQKHADEKQQLSATEAEKKALIDQLSEPSNVSEEEAIKRVSRIIERATSNGLKEVQVLRFPNELCTDRGRAINQAEPGWQDTLTGLPREMFQFWDRVLRPRGYRLRCYIIDFPDGMLGDVGLTLQWG